MEPLRNMVDYCSKTDTCINCSYHNVCYEYRMLGLVLPGVLSADLLRILSKYYDIVEQNGVKSMHRKKVK